MSAPKPAQRTSALKNVPYSGTQPRIVIGMDIGTTFSGAAYSFLRPGQVSSVYGVNRYVQMQGRLL